MFRPVIQQKFLITNIVITELYECLRKLDKRGRGLEARWREVESIERDLDSRERVLSQRNTQSSGSEPQQYSNTPYTSPDDKFRLVDGDRAERRGEDSQATGSDVTVGLKPVRRNSLPYEQPNMSKSEFGLLHNLYML